MPDGYKNFSRSLIVTPPTPGLSGTTLVVQTGQGARFPVPPFNAVVCPQNTPPNVSNAEIVRVTAITGDSFTIIRNQESTNSRDIIATDQIYAGITTKFLSDINTAVTTVLANTQTVSYTLALTDIGNCVELNSATATVLTVPLNSAVAFPLGTVVEVCRLGAGTVTITPTAGVVLRNRLEVVGTTSRTIPSQYASVSLRKRAADEWVMLGDLA